MYFELPMAGRNLMRPPLSDATPVARGGGVGM